MKILAHRGVSDLAPENTIKAFQLALEHQADGIEFDVFQHGDEHLIIHDRWLERTTNGRGSIHDHCLSTLSELDAGHGQSIPQVAELIELVRGRCELNFELKGMHDHRLFCELLDFSVEQGFKEEQLLVSSFNHHWLYRIKQYRPHTHLGALIAHYPIDFAAEPEKLGVDNVHIDVSVVDHAFIEDAHRRGLKVMVYTVDQPETLKQLSNWGVDGVFSNNPARAREILSAV